jgi:predicted dehydrogenase
MKRKINILIVGTASRAQSLIRTIVQMPDVNILAICDLLPERMEKAANIITNAGRAIPKMHTDYKQLLDLKGLDAVIVATNWSSHFTISIDAMNAGLYVGTEVGCASSLQECYELVKTSEKTSKPCMMLENCCYGKNEMLIGNMVKKGIFGDVVAATCGYMHDLRVIAKQQHPYRLMQNICRYGDLYLTHGLGPVCQWLNINRGNRILSVVSMTSLSYGFNSYLQENMPEDKKRQNIRFNNGDFTETLIRCANGEVITITHSISLPIPYSRRNGLYGTKASYSEDCKGICIDGGSYPNEQKWTPIEDFYAQYNDSIWKDFEQSEIKSDHGGMDYLVLRAFFDAVKKQCQTPIDVYDTATWAAVSILSEQSIIHGSSPVFMPDFTNGKWMPEGL